MQSETSARYAVYFAPADGSPLAEFGETVLGRSATLPQQQPGKCPYPDKEFWQQVTSAPVFYGFHATLKAPFYLRAGATLDALQAAVQALASRLEPVALDNLQPAMLGRFPALLLAVGGQPAQQVAALAAACVQELDHLREPLTGADIERKRAAGLSAAQDDNLLRWGYPYVLDDFRFHMTLGGKLDTPAAGAWLTWLQNEYRNQVPERVMLDRLAIFSQPDRSSAFVRESEHLLGAAG